MDDNSLFSWSGDDQRADNAAALPQEAVLVMALWIVGPHIETVLNRHMEHYAMLGFTSYLLYVRPGKGMKAARAMPQLTKWADRGFLKIVQWDAVPEHVERPFWDQRLVYNHALLSHLGRATFVAIFDLDEYVS